MNATTIKALAASDVTKAPAMRPILSEDGVRTGLWETLAESVAVVAGKPAPVPAGMRLTDPISAGHYATIGRSECRRTVDGLLLHYRA
jgi:hypothetical protein